MDVQFTWTIFPVSTYEGDSKNIVVKSITIPHGYFLLLCMLGDFLNWIPGIVNFFCWHLLICTGLTSVRPTYKFVICFDTKIFLSGTKEEIPCDHFLVTMSLLRLFIDSDVWGKRNSFLVGEVGSVGRLPISFGRDPSVFWAGAQTTGPARASPERVVCLSLLALVQVSRAASGRCGHWEVFLTHPWVAGWAVLFLCCPH